MAKRTRLIVAIDGPAGAGKSTVARAVADRVGYVLVDTGALYRSVALAADRAGLTLLAEGGTKAADLSADDEASLGDLAEQLAQARAIVLEPSGRVLLEGEDVSTAIRTPRMSIGASRVSAIPRVRTALLSMQRQAGEQGGAVMEGRDIGTVVFPDADLKFFLTASASERAERRHAELVQKGQHVSYTDTLADVEARDKADTEREVAPLREAADAIRIDSSRREIADVVEAIVREIERKEALR